MSQDSVSASSTDSVVRKTAERRVRLPVSSPKGADDAGIYGFLQSVFQGPSFAEFQLSREDPFFEPSDCLLLRRGRRIIAHAQIAHRTMQFGAVQIPVAKLGWLGVVPERRDQGLGAHLLHAAECRMADDGALLGMLQTSIPHFFRRTGWALCRPMSWRRADARALLARLWDRGLISRQRRRFHIRPWLQWEQAALARIYRQNVSEAEFETIRLAAAAAVRKDCGPTGRRPPSDCELSRHEWTNVQCTSYGPLERTAAYWHWLLNRHAHDEVYVALEGPEQLELGEISTHIVGYVVTRGEQILELMAAPNCPWAAVELLARCCDDAIERDRHCVLLHAPPCCALFDLFDEADGCGPPLVSDHGEVGMIRLVNPLEFLRRLCGEFDRRASEAGLPRPLDVGLLVEGQKCQIEVGRENTTVTSQRIGRSYLQLNVADFTRLVLGQLDWEKAVADGRLVCSTALARQAGPVLFPSLPLWRPPWDDMPAGA